MNNRMPNVLIAGGSGLVGSRLSQLLSESGYQVRHLSRRAPADAPYPTFRWDLDQGWIDESALRDIDFVVNLAGAGVADKRWTTRRKALITSSRTQSARLLGRYIQQMDIVPRAYLSASAIGYYGNSGEKLMKEDDQQGSGFLADSTAAWEAAIEETGRPAGMRVTAFRIGLVLSTRGGALPQLLLPLRFFIGVYFGHGRQWYSWIHIDDLCRMFIWAMESEGLSGKYNAAAPRPMRNKAFTRELIAALGRPALLAPAPVFALRLVLGEMADAVLWSQRISAEKILAAGFTFQFPELRPALEDVLRRRV
jgi:uncharacterized protein (TIGR01777 family)